MDVLSHRSLENKSTGGIDRGEKVHAPRMLAQVVAYGILEFLLFLLVFMDLGKLETTITHREASSHDAAGLICAGGNDEYSYHIAIGRNFFETNHSKNPRRNT